MFAVLFCILASAFADECEKTSLVQMKRATASTLVSGGFCLAAYRHRCTWGLQANVIAPGSFQQNALLPPTKSNWAGQPYPGGVWLTIGGVGVGVTSPADCLNIDKIVAEAKLVGATGLAFDMEGCLAGKTADLVAALEKAGKPMPTMYVPLGGVNDKPKYEDVKGAFDVIAPMLYYGDGSYQSQGITCNMIKTWPGPDVNFSHAVCRLYYSSGRC